MQLTLSEPAGLVPDLGGPRVYTLADLLRSYLHANHLRRLIIPVWLPGQAALYSGSGSYAAGQARAQGWTAHPMHQPSARQRLAWSWVISEA